MEGERLVSRIYNKKTGLRKKIQVSFKYSDPPVFF